MRNRFLRLLSAAAIWGLAASVSPAQQYPSWPRAAGPVSAAAPGFNLMPLETPAPVLPVSTRSILQPPTPAGQNKTPAQTTEPPKIKDESVPPVPIPDTAMFSVLDAPDEPFIQQLVGWDGTRGPALFVHAKYLLWWVKDAEAPPLTVVGPLAAPTSVIGGGALPFEDSQRSGGRFSIGTWLDFRQTLAAEAGYFFIAPRNQSLTVSSTGVPVISRVFIDAATGAPGSVTLATPGGFFLPPGQTGSSTVDAFSRLWGADGHLKSELHRAGWGFIDVLAGVRFVQLDEGLKITDVTKFAPAPVVKSDALIISRDEFGTHNQFIGGEVGLASEVRMGPVFLDIHGKTALGRNRQTVVINGSTSITAPPPPLLGSASFVGGISALPTNIGRYHRNIFAAIPQAGASVGYQFNDYVRASIGYSFMFITNVVRPGDQIDVGINPTRIPQNLVAPAGVARPSFGFRDTDFWAQGLNFGLEVRY